MAFLLSSALASFASLCSCFFSLSSANSANRSSTLTSAVWFWVMAPIRAFWACSSLMNAISFSLASFERVKTYFYLIFMKTIVAGRSIMDKTFSAQSLTLFLVQKRRLSIVKTFLILRNETIHCRSLQQTKSHDKDLTALQLLLTGSEFCRLKEQSSKYLKKVRQTLIKGCCGWFEPKL